MTLTVTLTHHPDTSIIHCSGNSEELFGCTGDQLVGRRLADIGVYFLHLNGKRVAAEEHPLQQILTGTGKVSGSTIGIFNREHAVLHWVEIDGRAQLNDHGEIIQVITTYKDSGEIIQRNVKNPAVQSEDQWEKTFDALQDAVSILSPDLFVLRANKAAYDIFGRVYGELVGKPCFEAFQGKTEPCPDCPAWQPDLNKAAEKGTVHHHELQKTFEVTSSAVLDDNGKLHYLVHSARDITTQIEDEATRNILSAAVEQTSESVVITDTNGIITYVNPSYSKTTRYTAEELLGNKLDFLNINQDSTALFGEILHKLKNGETWQGRLTSRRKDGTTLKENATISPIIQQNGHISNFVAVKRDISREEQLQNQLQQAMKLEAIGTLAGGIAHDFNNILSAMIGYGQIAKGRLAQDDPLFDDIEQILLAGDRATNLVKQILTFSRSDTDDSFHPSRLQYIIKEVGKLLRSSLPSTIELRQEVDPGCAAILADPNQIHQLIMNLCTNAKQAIGGNYGSIKISLQQTSIKEPRLLNNAVPLPSGDYVHLTVEDSGSGMSEAVLARIFEPFFTTKAKGQGTGLGLSIVHNIVEKHSGFISIDSSVAVGTTVHIFFPAIHAEIKTDGEEIEMDSGGTERIMVVDDETVLARMLEKMFTKLGYQITLYSDSLEAVREFRRTPYAFDLVITDMTMPHMTGAELAREMLSLRPDLPIIMLTGYSETIDEEKASRIGITTFMLKPMKKNILAQTVRKVLDNAQNSCN